MIQKLKPFSPPPLDLNIETEIRFFSKNQKPYFTLSFKLSGELHEIDLLDQPLAKPKKSHELWKNTCFEWFLKPHSGTTYWEFNASPMGEWNFYELEDYRKNLKESSLLPEPKINAGFIPQSKTHMDHYSYTLECSLESYHPQLIAGQETLHMAITSVIKWKSGSISYYSLQHPKEKPDFHSKKGFVIPISYPVSFKKSE